ncbi:metal-dependent protein hydrolase [Dipodascopsis tothii]|uniref:metal-dependent protein hydrolase n=1 Tax=Dipodascopsis tothii TaxID=44089 RepID=UPI0034CF28F3
MTEQNSKKPRTALTIGTHNGTFHADEALAVYMLKMLPRFKDATVVRSRTPDVLEACDIIVDVSGVYDGTKHFDHHQRGFAETFAPEYATKLSSAGLVYKHFGREIIATALDVDAADAAVETVYGHLYRQFVEAIDANDNGQSAYPEDVKPAFATGGITLPSMVADLNPAWNADSSDEALFAGFERASALIGGVFAGKLQYYGRAWLPARAVVQAALAAAADPRVLVLEQFVPWKDHLYALEAELGAEGRTQYVLYPDKTSWRIQAVAVSPASFVSRRALPEPWRGLRDDALSAVVGAGAVFVHASGFIGGHSTRDGALHMANMALSDS